MKLNFNFNLPDFEGKPQKDANAGKILADMLGKQNKGASIKLYDWAMSLWHGKPIDVDATDFDMLRGIIDTTEFLTIMAKVPCIKYMDKVKEKEK